MQKAAAAKVAITILASLVVAATSASTGTYNLKACHAVEAKNAGRREDTTGKRDVVISVIEGGAKLKISADFTATSPVYLAKSAYLQIQRRAPDDGHYTQYRADEEDAQGMYVRIVAPYTYDAGENIKSARNAYFSQKGSLTQFTRDDIVVANPWAAAPPGDNRAYVGRLGEYKPGASPKFTVTENLCIDSASV